MSIARTYLMRTVINFTKVNKDDITLMNKYDAATNASFEKDLFYRH